MKVALPRYANTVVKPMVSQCREHFRCCSRKSDNGEHCKQSTP